MLHWLRDAFKHRWVRTHLLCAVSMMHVMVIIPLFVSYHTDIYRMQINAHCQRILPVTTMAHTTNNICSVSLATDIDVSGVKTIVALPQPKKTAIKKSVPQPKKPVVKKAQPTKKVDQSKKVEAKKEVASKKVTTPIKNNDLVQKKVNQATTPQPTHEKEVAQLQQPEDINAIMPIDSAHDIVMKVELERKIRSQWAPPEGLSPNTSCDLCMTIDAQGNVCEVSIVRSSGMLMFDLMAQAGCKHIEQLPSWAYGKEFLITFNS